MTDPPSDKHRHTQPPGRYSTGQEQDPETAEKEHRGDFAEGQQAGHDSIHDPVGSEFAEGQDTGRERGHPDEAGFARAHEHDAS